MRVLAITLLGFSLSSAASALTPRLPDDTELHPPSVNCSDWLTSHGRANDATTPWLLQYWRNQKYAAAGSSSFLRERISRLDGYDQEFVDGVAQLCTQQPTAYFVSVVLQIRNRFQAEEMRHVLGPTVSVAPLVHPLPKYPGRAKDLNVRGFVDVYFVIEPDGSISDPGVLREIPEGYGFGAAALAVLPSWRFPPQLQNGKPAASGAIWRVPFLQ